MESPTSDHLSGLSEKFGLGSKFLLLLIHYSCRHTDSVDHYLKCGFLNLVLLDCQAEGKTGQLESHKDEERV